MTTSPWQSESTPLQVPAVVISLLLPWQPSGSQDPEPPALGAQVPSGCPVFACKQSSQLPLQAASQQTWL